MAPPKPAPDLIDGYLDRLRLRDYSPATLAAYRSDLRHAEAAIGAPLERATPAGLRVYFAGLARRGVSSKTSRRRQSSLRGFFGHALRVGAVTVDPTVDFEAPKLEELLPIYLSAAQADALLAALADDTPLAAREAAIVKCLYYTGMRAGELVALNIDDLNLAERQLRVIGKGRRERILPVPAELAAALLCWLDHHPTGRGALFVKVRGNHKRLGYRYVAKVMTAVLARAGLAGRKFSCHKLRHTFATRLINDPSRRFRIEKVQKLLGHRRIDTTTIYAHTELGRNLADDLDQVL